jgi:hypothetical protein
VWYVICHYLIFNIRKLYCVPCQIVSVYNGSQKKLRALPGMDIQWPGGTAPLDVPVCGFKNDNPACLARQWTPSVSHSLLYTLPPIKCLCLHDVAEFILVISSVKTAYDD